MREYIVAAVASSIAADTVAFIVVAGDAEDVPSSIVESCRELGRGCWGTEEQPRRQNGAARLSIVGTNTIA